jgi:hypothetical protein
MMPGGPNGQNGLPLVRKLALDLNGVAGFAILDQEGDDLEAGVVTPTPAGAGGSNLKSSRSSTLWLSSSSAGQELRAAAPSSHIDDVSIRQTVLGKRGMGSAARPPNMSGWAAQEDPGAPVPPADADPSTIDPAASGEPPSDDAAEQAGLLKITEDGEAVPALVALEEAPLDEAPGADAGAPSGEGPPNAEPGAADAGAGPVDPQPPGPNTGGAPGPGTVGPLAPPPRYEPLPRVTAVGLSPDGSVYILFERSFFHRQPDPADLVEGFDPFAQGSPYRCQLFRANGSWQNGGAAQAPLAELECVTSDYEIRTWDARRVMQFDASGKLYFRAATPGNNKEVFYQYNPETKTLSEKVNGNICWRDVQVTPRGSLFYTGTTGTNGDCSGTSFFRYVSSDNRLSEIARDWWNFKYLAEQDPADPDNERIIFYGPDPNASGGSGWETACLYRYNPAIEAAAERTEKLVECVSNPYNYIYGSSNGPVPVTAENRPAFGERCSSEGQLFVGGEGATGLSQLKDGTLFVVGTFQEKLAGEVVCGMDITVDHCTSLDPAHTDEELCLSATADPPNEWIRAQPHCVGHPEITDPSACQAVPAQWNSQVGFRHYDRSGAACIDASEDFVRNFIDCRTPGQSGNGPQPPSNLTRQVEGLAYLVPGTDGGLSRLQLLSEPTEVVERYWALEGENGPELYYSTYNAGEYSLRRATQVENGEGVVEVERRLILEDFEVYNLQRDPADPSRVLFDALQFSTNDYVFGSVDTTLPTPEEVQASIEAVQGVSGRVETLIVLPNF